MFELINILAPTCMIFILLFGVFSSVIAKKNEHKVEIPEEYIGKENIYLQLQQHQWTMILVYSEVLVFLLWSISSLFEGFGNLPSQCADDCPKQIILIFTAFFLKLLVVLSSMLVTMKYDTRKSNDYLSVQ